MNAIHPASVGSSDMSDLDGYSIPGDYNYNMQSQYGAGAEDFGFDPPNTNVFSKPEPYSPPNSDDPLQLSAWSGFDDKDNMLGSQSQSQPQPQSQSHNAVSAQNFELNGIFSKQPSNVSASISRYGQVTPPRSNSASSEDKNNSAMSPKHGTIERRKRSTKTTVKEEVEPNQAATTGRKRKNKRKSSVAKDEQDDKRRQSLEKNRLAAAKCRVNKKEKTEQLQRSSHEKAVHNAFLKEQVMRMKEEVQQMNAFLLAHANCEGCKSPDEIQKHLSNLGNEYMAHHVSSMSYDYPTADMDDMSHMRQESGMHSDYYGSNNGAPTMLNPPLPEFDRNAEFEVHTPMHAD